MNLNNFEKQIEPRILERGRRYFDDGRVLSIEKKDLLVYEALIGGTERYTVSIALDGDGNIQETECDCPYMLGEYCKHQVAAFLALQVMLVEPGNLPRHGLSGESVASSGQMAQLNGTGTLRAQSVPIGSSVSSVPHILPFPSDSRQSWQTRLNQTLNQRSKDELIQYMIDLASDDETIRHQIELRFGDQDEPAAIKQAIQVIRAHIANAADRHGFVGYSGTFTATRGAAMVLEKAREACSRGRMQHALDLALSTLREMIALVNKCDDSDGNVGDIIAECIGTIGEIVAIAELAAIPEEKTQLFNKLLAEAAHRRYEGWDDWQLDLLKCCAMLASTPKLRAKLDKRLAAMTDMTAMTAADATESWSRQYKAEEIALIQYEMVKRLDGQAAAQTFIANHLNYSAFRKIEYSGGLGQAIRSDLNSRIRCYLDT